MTTDVLTLSLRGRVTTRLDVEGVTPDRLATLDARDIASIPVWIGSRVATLGDFFHIHGGRSHRVRIEGDLSLVDGLAAGATAGELVVHGNVGRRLGAGMSGGSIHVIGNAGDDAGCGMSGGVLRVTGNTGHRLAAGLPGASKGMTGGEVIVEGSAGHDAAARARRGLVVVVGDCGESAGRAMIAGTLVVLGGTGVNPGCGSKRGSIVAAGRITVPSTYRYACTFQPPYVRLTVTYLRQRYGLQIADVVRDGMYRRYCGDAGNPGKGEILELT
jgi:formylmethanofuran dehydrogenase subunit C